MKPTIFAFLLLLFADARAASTPTAPGFPPITAPSTQPAFILSGSAAKPAAITVRKPGWLQRWVLRQYTKKLSKKWMQAEGQSRADKKATLSLWMGIASLVLLFVPYGILAVIPLAILAIIFGSEAIRGGTAKHSAARVGKAFGLASLILFAVFLIIALIWLSAWGGIFG